MSGSDSFDVYPALRDWLGGFLWISVRLIFVTAGGRTGADCERSNRSNRSCCIRTRAKGFFRISDGAVCIGEGTGRRSGIGMAGCCFFGGVASSCGSSKILSSGCMKTFFSPLRTRLLPLLVRLRALSISCLTAAARSP